LYKKTKLATVFVLFLSFIIFLSGCETSSTGTATQRLNAQIAGIGTIRDIDSEEILTGNQYTMYSERYLRDDRVRLRAEGAANQNFLFWADNNIGNIYNARQDIRMDSNKNIMAVFGGEEVFLSGYIHESAQNKNVIGFWKALRDYPEIEIYVRDTRYLTERYRYFYDDINESDPDEHIILRNEADHDSEFIAALFRIEKPEEELEYSKLLFIYADITVFQTVVLDEDEYHRFDTAQDEYTDEYGNVDDREGFISYVRETIYQNRNKDIIIGSTAWPYDGSSN